ncbi:MAG: hypothetical protein EOP05_22260 [Proteobacteria bacterium]|nr:MAG: hypothetical protein EOP05_22260 [Pseudomonadota bacterium]
MTRFWKVLISVFLAYHLAAVILLPNSSSIIGRQLGWFFLPYANPLLFNRTWQFFSPGPAKAFFLEYEVYLEGDDGMGSDDTKLFTYPTGSDRFKLDDYYMRMLAGVQFVAIQPVPFAKYFVPYLCKKHPGAESLNIRTIFEDLPAIEAATRDKSFEEMAKRVDTPRQTYPCNIEGAP